MKISLITVCKNSKDSIDRTIQSVLSQTYKNIEYIIIDGASNDGTLSIINNYKNKVSLIISENDNGVYDAMNKGLKHANGDIIGFINADDSLYNKYCINNIVDHFKKNNADIVYGDINLVSKNQKLIHSWRANKFKKNSFINGWHPPHPSFYAKKRVYAIVGDYDCNLEFSADFDFMYRAFEMHSFKVEYLPEVFVNYTLGGGSSKNIKNILIGNYNIFKSLKKNKVNINFFYYFFKRLIPKLGRFIKHKIL